MYMLNTYNCCNLNLIKCSIYFDSLYSSTHELAPFSELFPLISWPKNFRKISTAKYVLLNSYQLKCHDRQRKEHQEHRFYCQQQKKPAKSGKKRFRTRKIN